LISAHPEEKITPFVQQRYPAACSKGPGRECTPCYSLVRRYRRDERQSHGIHRDGHAIATVVVSLSEYGRDYRGGLYVVSPASSTRQYLALKSGDAVVHQSHLLHGVQVYDLPENPEQTVRWSWILWYRDSAQCEDFGHEWFRECAQVRTYVYVCVCVCVVVLCVFV
jgi:hypothetical protein